MPIPLKTPLLNDVFFQPLSGPARCCPEFSDGRWLLSGRAFLQEHGPGLPRHPSHSNYFNSLHSERRLELIRDVHRSVLGDAQLPDRLAAIAELERYEVFAGDGHWLKAATHNPRDREAKMAVGHFYSLNLRGHQLQALATGEGL